MVAGWEGSMGRADFDRTAVEAAIMAEDTVLEQCLDGIDARVPVSEWPQAARDAFLGAIAEDQRGNERERAKARDLRQHLFRGRPGPAPRPEFARLTTAERVRADLIGLVKPGAGTYLTEGQ